MQQKRLFEIEKPALNLKPFGFRLEIGVDALVVFISGGKDSDCMLKELAAARHRYQWYIPLIAVHCDVGRMEWAETLPHCQAMAEKYADEFVVLRHDTDLVDAMYQRHETRPEVPPFPSSAARYCTAGWKREVADKWIRGRWTEDASIICAMGLRDEESPARAKKPDCWDRNSAAPTKNRRVIDWLPIRHYTLSHVWQTLGYTLDELATLQALYQHYKTEGQAFDIELLEDAFKAHPAYLRGNHRLSCMMCVLADENDLRNGAEYNPDLYRELVRLEDISGFAFQQNKPLSRLRPDLLED